MQRKIFIIIIIAVMSSFSIIFFTQSNTTIPIPEPLSSINATTKIVEVVAGNLSVPWAIDISRDGRIFFTEREGLIKVIDNNQSLPKIASYIRVFNEGEAGLLGLSLHPNFTENHLLYIYHTYSNNGTIKNKILQLREENNTIIESKIILDNIPGNKVNNGGRIEFGPDGKIYVSTGDANNPHLSQNLSSLAGKILRLNEDGTVPNDNPFNNSLIYSLGHRNIQGLAWQFNTNKLFVSEHGSSGNDEINIIHPGENYGWPLEECSGEIYAKPFACFTPAIAPSGISFTNTTEEEQEILLITTLRGSHLRGIDIESKQQDNILVGYGRLRDIVNGPDDSIYVTTSNKDGRGIPQRGDDKILKILNPYLSN